VTELSSPETRQAPGTVGGVRYFNGGVQDRWLRDEAAVHEQMELGREIVEALAGCIERGAEIEPGRSAGPRMFRRLEVSRRIFQRLADRDAIILTEFEAYRAEEQRRVLSRAEKRRQTAADEGRSEFFSV
jgi:hypothetical protein